MYIRNKHLKSSGDQLRIIPEGESDVEKNVCDREQSTVPRDRTPLYERQR